MSLLLLLKSHVAPTPPPEETGGVALDWYRKGEQPKQMPNYYWLARRGQEMMRVKMQDDEDLIMLIEMF